MAYYDQGNPEAGKSRSGKTPGRLHDDRRWRSMVWAFFGLVIGLLFGAIGTALMGDSVNRNPLPAATVPTAPFTQQAADDCRLTGDGVISETPCLLEAEVLAAMMDPDGPTDLLGSRTPPQMPNPLPLCDRTDDGAVLGAPCRILSDILPPMSTASAAAETDRPPLCRVGADGSVTGARCILMADIPAPAPAAAPEPIPAADPLPACQISIMDGTVTGAPCQLTSNFRASRASRTLDAPVQPASAPLAACRIDRTTQAITNAPCKLETAFRPVLDANFGPVPKTALKACPTRGYTTPENLSCGLRVRDSGYVALSKIAEAYYGDTDAACMIYDSNRDVFGTRASPIRRNDPHCILPEDILFMPATEPDAEFPPCQTPPRQANVCQAG